MATSASASRPGTAASLRAAASRLAPAALALTLLALIAVPVAQVLHAHRVNGVDGFPIDDAWIHLTFARHLHEGLGFVYSTHQPPTAGSTSPLYTGILAAFFGLLGDEKRLSYALDIAFHAVFLCAFADWAKSRLRGTWWAVAAVALVGLDTRVLILSASGMETSLFLALVALAFATYARGWWTACGVALGAAVWTRPEGLILTGILVSVAALPAGDGAPSARGGRMLRLAVPAIALAAAYALFNHHLSGQFFPNTFAAKRAAIYPPIPPLTFLRGDVLPFLTDHGWVALFPALLAGLGLEAWALVRRRAGTVLPEAAWIVGVLAAYALLLPIGHRFDRYLVPVLPAAALVALAALQRLARAVTASAGRGWLQHAGPAVPVALAAAALLHVTAPADAFREYARWCKYHGDRHERAGRWLAAHTPPDAVIATHDIGAIAFYSHRQIVDIAGLVSPEVVPHLRQPGFTEYLGGLFARYHVTHLAMLREWMQVTNVAPQFVADPRPEILEIFPWRPGATHLVSREATSEALTAQAYLRAGQAAEAAVAAQRSVALDSLNADGWTVWGYASGMAGRPDIAAADFERALRLRPGDRQARLGLARLAIDANRGGEARALLDSLIAEVPDDADARDLLTRLPEAPAGR